MLKKLRRKKTAKKIWAVLAILIVPAFVFWGSGSLIRSKQESNYAGKISGKKIPLLEYKGALEAVKNQAIMQFGDNFSTIQKYLNLESQAWVRLILLREAKKRKINVSDQETIELIKSYPFLQRNGRFDNRLYSEMLQYLFRTQPRIFEEQIRQNLMLAKLYQEVTKVLTLSEKEILDEYRKSNLEMSIYYLASLPTDFLREVIPSEQDIQDYFAKNSLEFKQPLSFNIEYISLDSQDKLKSILSRLNKKEDLNKIAKEVGLEIKESGVFRQTDSIPGIGWSPQILNLISKLKVGQYVAPLYIDKHYYILRLKEKREPYIPDLEAIKDKVKEVFIKNKARQIAQEKIENCLKKLKEEYLINPKGVDFNKLAEGHGLKSGSTDLFKYGSYIEGIGSSDNFWMVAQGLKEDEISSVIDTGLSGFYIIKLKSQVPLDNQKFEREKVEFSQRLLTQKKQEYFTEFTEEWKRKAQRLTNLP